MNRSERPILHKFEFSATDGEDNARATTQMAPQYSGMMFARVFYPADVFLGQAASVWHVGVVRTPFKNISCGIANTKSRERVVSAGEVVVIPPDGDYSGGHGTQAEIDFLVLTQDRMAAALHAQQQHRSYEPHSCETYFHSAVVSTLVKRVIASAERSTGFDPHHADNFANAIVSDLFTAQSPTENEHAIGRIGLSQTQLKLIDEIIDAGPDVPVTNGALSVALNMPESTFARAFKKATGETPYQYVLRRRIERAQNLIATTDLSISHIAYFCGFSSQSHLTDVFRAKVGASPSALRRQMRKGD